MVVVKLNSTVLNSRHRAKLVLVSIRGNLRYAMFDTNPLKPGT